MDLLKKVRWETNIKALKEIMNLTFKGKKYWTILYKCMHKKARKSKRTGTNGIWEISQMEGEVATHKTDKKNCRWRYFFWLSSRRGIKNRKKKLLEPVDKKQTLRHYSGACGTFGSLCFLGFFFCSFLTDSGSGSIISRRSWRGEVAIGADATALKAALRQLRRNVCSRWRYSGWERTSAWQIATASEGEMYYCQKPAIKRRKKIDERGLWTGGDEENERKNAREWEVEWKHRTTRMGKRSAQCARKEIDEGW